MDGFEALHFAMSCRFDVNEDMKCGATMSISTLELKKYSHLIGISCTEEYELNLSL